MVGAVEGEVAQGGELGFDPVQPAGVERDVGQLDVVGRGPVADPASSLVERCGLKLSSTMAMRTWVGYRRAQIAAERQELGAALAAVDVPVQPVAAQVVGGQEVPDAVRSGEGGPAPPTPGSLRLACRLGAPTACRGGAAG